jgi:hypothetical protein
MLLVSATREAPVRTEPVPQAPLGQILLTELLSCYLHSGTVARSVTFLTFCTPAALQVQLIDFSPDMWLLTSAPEMIV